MLITNCLICYSLSILWSAVFWVHCTVCDYSILQHNPQLKTHHRTLLFCCLNFLYTHSHSHYIQHYSNPDRSIVNHLHKSTDHCSVLAPKRKHGCVQYMALNAKSSIPSGPSRCTNTHHPVTTSLLLVSTSSTHFWSTPHDFNPFALGTTAAMDCLFTQLPATT